MTHHIPHRPVWTPCGTCWGQRRIWRDESGRGLRPEACPACLGLGERLAGADQLPAPSPAG